MKAVILSLSKLHLDADVYHIEEVITYFVGFISINSDVVQELDI